MKISLWTSFESMLLQYQEDMRWLVKKLTILYGLTPPRPSRVSPEWPAVDALGDALPGIPFTGVLPRNARRLGLRLRGRGRRVVVQCAGVEFFLTLAHYMEKYLSLTTLPTLRILALRLHVRQRACGRLPHALPHAHPTLRPFSAAPRPRHRRRGLQLLQAARQQVVTEWGGGEGEKSGRMVWNGKVDFTW